MLVVYTITKNPNKPDEKGYWTRVGVAFQNRDGSFNLRLNALPVNGELHMREQTDEERPQQSGGRRQGGYQQQPPRQQHRTRQEPPPVAPPPPPPPPPDGGGFDDIPY